MPALFGQWAAPVAEPARIAPGDDVLDVACGTGVLAKEATRRAGPGGAVIGLDCNAGMLDVARKRQPGIDWRQDRAESLPFPDASFDAVVSQFGLMFFDDPGAALGEMWWVLRPGGRLAVAVRGPLERAPGYVALVRLLDRLFGERAAREMQAPFVLGDTGRLGALFTEVGIADHAIDTRDGVARFASIEARMHTDVKGWTLSHLIDDAGYQRLLEAAETDLAGFRQADGTVAFSFPAHIVTAAKPRG